MVNENAVDTELIHKALAPAMGIKGPFMPGTLRPLAARTAVANVVARPSDVPAFTDTGIVPISLTLARRAAIAVVRANDQSGHDNDPTPTAGAVVTKKVKRLRPKYVG